MRSNSAYAEGDLLSLRDLLEEKTGLYLPAERSNTQQTQAQSGSELS